MNANIIISEAKIFCFLIIAFLFGFRAIYSIWVSKKQFLAYLFALLGILCSIGNGLVQNTAAQHIIIGLCSFFYALSFLFGLYSKKNLTAIGTLVATTAFSFFSLKCGLNIATYFLVGAIIISLVLEFFNKTRTDNLTKVYNRFGQEIEIEKQLRQYKREKSDSFYIFYCDLDKFKEINDTWGHDDGDYVLKSVAAALSKVGQEFNATVFRNGGDEFILITDTSEDGLDIAVAAAIEEEVEHIKLRDGTPVRISVGSKKYAGEDINDFIDSADQKLYETKKEKAKTR